MPLSTFNTNIGLLDTAEISFTSNPPTITKGVRDAAKKLIEENVTVLLADVQRIANANPVHAIEIIESAILKWKPKRERLKLRALKIPMYRYYY